MTDKRAAFACLSGGKSPTARVLTVFGQTISERITADDSGGDYYVFDELTPPGAGVPPHTHSLDDEVVIIRKGEFEVYLDGSVTRAGPGAILNFARGTAHGFRCTGDGPGETTWIAMPGAHAQALLRTLSELPSGPPDMAALDRLHAEHGVTMPPPGDKWW